MPNETFDSINAWQDATFPNATAEGILNHLDEEWEEFKSAPTEIDKLTEAADLIILLTAYLGKKFVGGAQAGVDRKMKINRNRNWNILPDGTGRHT